MTRLVAAELVKFRTTRAAIGFVVLVVALVGLGTAGTVGSAKPEVLGTSDLSHDVLSGSVLAAIVVCLIGIVSVTSEWRHGTITRTCLVTPIRVRIVLAKALWISALAAFLALLALALAILVAATWLAIDGSPSLVLGWEHAGLAGRLVLVAVLWGTFGVAVGALVQSQTFAVVGAVIWILIVENLVTGLLGLVDAEAIGDYLPGRALSSFDGTEGGLSIWAGGAVAAIWVLALGALGALRLSRQDIT